MKIPVVVNAGDSVNWSEVAFSDPVLGLITGSGGWSLTFSFRGTQGAGGLDLAGTAAGSGWSFGLTPAQSSALNTGSAVVVWSWQAYATKGGARITAGTGVLRVRPNLAGLSASAAFDGRSQAEQDLEAVRAELKARVSGGLTVEYSIGARSLKKEPVESLLLLEQRCLRIVRRERQAQAAANGLGNPRRFGVRFR